ITNRQMSRPHCIDRSDLESEDILEEPIQEPVVVTASNGDPGLVGCSCEVCNRARELAGWTPTVELTATHQEPVLRDPDTGHPLDESGRFFVPPAPEPGAWCAACGVHH